MLKILNKTLAIGNAKVNIFFAYHKPNCKPLFINSNSDKSKAVNPSSYVSFYFLPRSESPKTRISSKTGDFKSLQLLNWKSIHLFPMHQFSTPKSKEAILNDYQKNLDRAQKLHKRLELPEFNQDKSLGSIIMRSFIENGNFRGDINYSQKKKLEEFILTDFLSIINRDYITFNKLQHRFENCHKEHYFPNIGILQEYFDIISQDLASIHFFGPKQIGKSINLCFMRNLLMLNNKDYRCIYIHNTQAFLESDDPFIYIGNDLLFTFCDLAAIDTFRNLLEALFDTNDDGRLHTLRSLLRQIPEKKVFMIDQYNEFSKLTDQMIKNSSTASLAIKIIKVLEACCEIKIRVSSITDESFLAEKKNQEFDSKYLYSRLSTANEVLLEYAEKLKLQIPESKKTEILGVTNYFPGEIRVLLRQKDNDIDTKIIEYTKQKELEITQDLKNFMTKSRNNLDSTKKDNNDEILRNMIEVATKIDTGKELSLSMNEYDGRYIILKDNCAYSLIPCVRKVMQKLFLARNYYIKEMLSTTDERVLGILFQDYILSKLFQDSDPSLNFSRLSLKLFIPNENSSIPSQELTISMSIKKKQMLDFEIKIQDQDQDDQDVLLVPRNHYYFPGIDLLLYLNNSTSIKMNNTKLLVAIQIKTNLSEYPEFRDFIENQDGPDKNEIRGKLEKFALDTKSEIIYVLLYLKSDRRIDQIDLKKESKDISNLYFCNAISNRWQIFEELAIFYPYTYKNR